MVKQIARETLSSVLSSNLMRVWQKDYLQRHCLLILKVQKNLELGTQAGKPNQLGDQVSTKQLLQMSTVTLEASNQQDNIQ